MTDFLSRVRRPSRPSLPRLLALAACLCLGARAFAAGDVEGGKDSPLITRFPGSTLVGYYHSDWNQTTFPLDATLDTENQHFLKPATVEGAVTRLVYLSPRGKSTLEVFRSYEQALKAAGIKTVFACDGNCNQLFFHWRFGAVRDAMKYTKEDLMAAQGGSRWNMADAPADDEGRLIYGTLASGGRQVHVLVYTSIAGYAPTEAAATVVEIAEPKAMQQGQVTVDAAAMGKGLAAEGKIALYGIYFDTAKSVLKPESDKQLGEMAKLLNGNKSLAVFIVGHTDNQGAFDANLKLSLARAQAVRDALVGRFHIDAARLTPYGVANVAPVASNAAEDGRARNRRVELVVR